MMHRDRRHDWRGPDGHESLWYELALGGWAECSTADCLRRHLWEQASGDPEAYALLIDPRGPECVALMPGEVSTL